MRTFVYYSKTAPTSGKNVNEKDLMASGRLDIAIHTIISAFFLSHKIRTDTTLHLIFTGPPDPPKHLELKPVTEGKTDIDKIYLNKKNIATIIKKMLYKYKKDKKTEVFPGYFIEKKSFLSLLQELYQEGKDLFILDSKGGDIRNLKISKDPVFILGDHEGIPKMKKELNRIKHELVSVGKRTYFASQILTIVNNEIDRREDSQIS